jgi:hypothetical protein
MSHRTRIRQRPRSSRIGDLESTHISGSLETGLLQRAEPPAPPLDHPRPLASHGAMR